MTYEFNTLGIIFTSVIGLLALLCIDGIILFSIGYKKRTVHTILYRIFAYILIILLLAVAALYLCYKLEVLSLRDVHQLMTLAFTGRQLLDFPREYIVDVFALFDTGLARIFIVATFVLALLSLILSYVRRYKAGFETGENDDAILPEDSEELALEDNDAEKEPEVIVAVPIEEALDEETPAEKETPAEEAAMVEEAAPVEEEVIVEKASTEESTEVIEEPTEEMATETTNEPVEEADLDEAIEQPAEEAVEQPVEPVVEPVEE